MIGEIIRAVIIGSLPVAIFTFLVLQWSIASGRLSRFEDSDALEQQFKDHRKAKAEAKAEAKRRKKAGEEPQVDAPKKPLFHKEAGQDLLHNKIMFFGGGFYGTMALLAYLVIEVDEVLDFLGVVFTPGEWFRNLGIDLIVNFIINSFINIGMAFAWFMTLPKYVDIGNGWIWLLAAYAGYMAGVKLVAEYGDVLWAELMKVLERAGVGLRQLFAVSRDKVLAERRRKDDKR